MHRGFILRRCIWIDVIYVWNSVKYNNFMCIFANRSTEKMRTHVQFSRDNLHHTYSNTVTVFQVVLWYLSYMVEMHCCNIIWKKNNFRVARNFISHVLRIDLDRYVGYVLILLIWVLFCTHKLTVDLIYHRLDHARGKRSPFYHSPTEKKVKTQNTNVELTRVYSSFSR